MEKQASLSITATEFVRNFSTVVDKVRLSGRSISITKGTQTIAKLSPANKAGCPMPELINLLSSTHNLGEDIEALSKDLLDIKQQARIPNTSWD